MKKLLLSTSVFISAIIFMGASVIFYMDRDQDLNFSRNLPSTLEICGMNIAEKDPQYIALSRWLQANNTEWNSILVSFAPTYVYRGENITINVNPDAVIVNYNVDGEWKQVRRLANTESIFGTCM